MNQKRECGVLLPVSSLPSKYGIGCFSKSAYDFVDALKEAGQSCWQILPLGPTSYGDSPYQSFSTFAGNPYFISLEDLIEEGVLTKKECDSADFGKNKISIDYASPYQSFSTFAGNPYFISLEDLIEEGVLTKKECDSADFGKNKISIDYAKIYKSRTALLRKAYERSKISENPDFVKFQQKEGWWLKNYALFMAVKERFDGEPWSEWAEDIRFRWQNALDYYRRELYFDIWWLKNYALFMAVKERFDGEPWSEWAEDIRFRWQNALDYYRRELYFDIEFQEYMQFKFYEQWKKLKAYANKKGIRIIGDIPIYVAMDSADTWASPWLFKLDEKNQPTQVAGCPPDGFSATGQLWGNPLYNWEVHRQSGFDWWVKRIEHCFSMYDIVRIDHFRGFDEYYAIPFGDKTAENGWWEKGPGMDLFRAVSNRLGERAIIAEDLGFMTDSVIQLVEDSGYPNMKVIEFAFDERDTGNKRLVGKRSRHGFIPCCFKPPR